METCDLSSEELFALVSKVQRWVYVPRIKIPGSFKPGEGTLLGRIQDVQIYLSYQRLSWVEGEEKDEWLLRAQLNDTILGHSHFNRDYSVSNIIQDDGREDLSDLYRRVFNSYTSCKDSHRAEDLAHARNVLNGQSSSLRTGSVSD